MAVCLSAIRRFRFQAVALKSDTLVFKTLTIIGRGFFLLVSTLQKNDQSRLVRPIGVLGWLRNRIDPRGIKLSKSGMLSLALMK